MVMDGLLSSQTWFSRDLSCLQFILSDASTVLMFRPVRIINSMFTVSVIVLATCKLLSAVCCSISLNLSLTYRLYHVVI